MYPYNTQAAQLPVPYDRPLNNGLWSQNPLNDPMIPLPQIPISQEFGWIVPTVVGALVSSLQDSCQRGPVSTFAYNLFSQNSYRNDYFMMVATEAVNYAVFCLKSSTNPNYQEEVMRAGAVYARVATASCVKHFPALVQFIPPNAQQDIQNTLAQWQGVKASMQNFQSSGYANRPQAQPTGYSERSIASVGGGSSIIGHGGGSIMAEDLSATRGRGAYADNRPRADGLTPQEQVSQPQVQQVQQQDYHPNGRPSAAGQYAERQIQGERILEDRPRADGYTDDGELPDINSLDFDSDCPNSFVEVDSLDLQMVNDSQEAGYPSKNNVDSSRVIARTPSMHQTASLNLGPNEEVEWIDQYLGHVAHNLEEESFEVRHFLGPVDRPWDAFLVARENEEEDDTLYLLTPAIISDTAQTRSQHQAHRATPYNPETHMLFHGVAYGTVEPVMEFIAPLEDSMRYVLHEFNESLRQKEQARLNERDNVKFNVKNLHTIEPRVAKATVEQDVSHLETLDERARTAEEGTEFNYSVRRKATILSGCDVITLDDNLARIEEYRAATLINDENGEEMPSLYEAYGTHQAKFFVREAHTADAVELINAYHAAPTGGLEAAMFLATYSDRIGKDRFYNRLNDILTARMNAVLYHSMGIVRLSADDYASDYNEILGELKEFGPAQLDAFHKLMDHHVAQLALTASSNSLTISTQYTVLQINRSLTAMGFFPMIDGKTDGAISVSTHRDLYLALAAVYERSKVMNRQKGGQVFIASVDDQVIQLHRSAWDKHYISVELIQHRSIR